MKHRVTFNEINTQNPMLRVVMVDTKNALSAKQQVYRTFGGMKKIHIKDVCEVG